MQLSQWLQAGALRALLWHRSRPALVGRALARCPYRRSRPVTGTTLRVAAVQRRLQLTLSVEEYAREAYAYTAAAVAYGAQLVCMPEYNGIPLLGLLPGLESLDATQPLDQALAAALGDDAADPSDLFRLVGPAAGRAFEITWSTLARRFGIYLVAGSLLLPSRDGTLYNTLLAYDPGGRRIGVQRKLHLSQSEIGWIAPGDSLTLMRLGPTALAAAIGPDQAYWEPARAAACRGAELLVSPQASTESSSWWTQTRGLWSRVQEVAAYGIQPMLVGGFFGSDFRGRSGIYAPLELSPAGDGVLASADDERHEAVIVADLDLAALRDLRRSAPAPRRELVARYLPRLYHEQPAGGVAAAAIASG